MQTEMHPGAGGNGTAEGGESSEETQARRRWEQGRTGKQTPGEY